MSKTKTKQKTIEELLEEALVPEEEQPYEVPGNWVWVRLGSYFTQIKEQIQPNGSEKYIGLENLKKDGGILDVASSEGVKSKKVVFHSGDVLYGRLRPYLNKHAYVDFNGVASTDILVYRSPYKNSNRLLDHYLGLPHVVQFANSNSNGINLPRISPKILNSLPVPLPPLHEQKRITKKVERLLNKIDEAKRLIEEAKETFELRRAAILDKAFRGELGTNNLNEQKIASIHPDDMIPQTDYPYQVPPNWLWVKSEIIAKWGSGGTPSRRKPEYYQGTIPWLKTGELRDSIIFDSEEKISEDAIRNSSAKLFPKGSIAIAMYGATIGRIGILGIDAATNQACAVGIPTLLTSTEYMFYYFLANKQRLINKGKGGAQPNISQTIIKAFPFALPPIEEQHRIVKKVKGLLRKLDTEEELIQLLNERLDTLKLSILSKAFRGELGTNDPIEESAVELLKEVLQERQK
jgi:type I restriction enzyme S subunit